MSQHTCERVALLRQRQADLHTAAASYAEALQASLAHQHALVEKSKAYNSQSAMLLYHIDEFEEVRRTFGLRPSPSVDKRVWPRMW